MKVLKILLSVLFVSILFLQGCGNDKSDTKIKSKTAKEVSTPSTQVIKKKKKDKPKKNTTVKVEATINGKKFDFDKVDPKHNSVVVLFNESFQLKYIDMKNQLILIHLYDSKLYQSTPITFSTQIASLPPKEQVIVEVKSSKLLINALASDPTILNREEFYKGSVVLEEFTEEKIVINFKGEGFPGGSNSGKDKLFPMEGTIVIENYNVHDARR